MDKYIDSPINKQCHYTTYNIKWVLMLNYYHNELTLNSFNFLFKNYYVMIKEKAGKMGVRRAFNFVK